MNEEERGARWQDLIEARADFADADEIVPLRAVSESGARRGHPSRKLARFDEALSTWSSWSSVERPQRRLSA
jgi:hypothetical protein